MKSVTGIAVMLLVLAAPLAMAQTIEDAIALTRGQIQADRQAIVAATLGLSEETGEAFWPMYREYRAEMETQGDRVWKLMIDFSERYDALSDADAVALLDEWMSIEKKQLRIRDKWVKKFSKAIGAASTARFFQIESKLDSMIRIDATAGIPLAEPAN